MATGRIPHQEMKPYDVMKAIEHGPPPTLDGTHHSDLMKDFINCILIKDSNRRPTAGELLAHPFLNQKKAIHTNTTSLLFLIQEMQESHSSEDEQAYPVDNEEAKHR